MSCWLNSRMRHGSRIWHESRMNVHPLTGRLRGRKHTPHLISQNPACRRPQPCQETARRAACCLRTARRCPRIDRARSPSREADRWAVGERSRWAGTSTWRSRPREYPFCSARTVAFARKREERDTEGVREVVIWKRLKSNSGDRKKNGKKVLRRKGRCGNRDSAGRRDIGKGNPTKI